MAEAEKAHGPTWSAAHRFETEEVLALLKRQSTEDSAGRKLGLQQFGIRVTRADCRQSFPGAPSIRCCAIVSSPLPLNMRDTVAYINGRIQYLIGRTGTQNNVGIHRDRPEFYFLATLGDGGNYSNLTDLAKWDNALQKHTLLSEAQIKPALMPVTLADGSAPHWPLTPGDDNLNPGKPVAYGFGWFLILIATAGECGIREPLWDFGPRLSGFPVIRRQS